jgi:hypothetical protein
MKYKLWEKLFTPTSLVHAGLDPACGMYVIYGKPRRRPVVSASGEAPFEGHRTLGYQPGRLVNVRVSEIHGLGLFAESPIRKGTLIGLYDGRSTWDIEALYSLIESAEDGSEWAIEGEGPLRFMNHQENPTCRCDGMLVYARRRIEAGAEMTIHYGKDWR